MNTTRRVLFLTPAALAHGLAGAEGELPSDSAQIDSIGELTAAGRRRRAYALRRSAAEYQRDEPFPAKRHSSDEELFASRIGNFTKGLPHNERGEVDPRAYEALLEACKRGDLDSFENVPMGGTAKLANPLASYAFAMEGADSHQFELRAAPAVSSAEAAGELIELYWRAAVHDLPFADYAASPLIEDCVKDLSGLSDFSGPRENGRVTAATVFRGNSRGDLPGPIISQFLWLPINYGGTPISQTWRPYPAGREYGTGYAAWLAIQNGAAQPPATREAQGRYIHSLRDLASYVHADFTYQAFLNAGLILQAMGSASARLDSPYAGSRSMAGFITFGAPMMLDLVARVALAALKAAWCEKWLVSRRLRPEAMAGLVHNTALKIAEYPLHPQVFRSPALTRTQAKHGTLLLPLAFPEGSPLHPSFPAGHAAIAGAGITVLKALCNERAEIPRPMVPSRDGSTLEEYKGTPLTVGGELDKLASNIAFGRDSAGIHYRSDSIEGIRLGEEVALSLLRECRLTLPERIGGFALTRYDGTVVRV
jgi:membrane-associated phospholipid phosphatase